MRVRLNGHVRPVSAGRLAVCVLLLAAPARGETLLDAIKIAYQSNPDLRAQQAQLRATNEDYVQARAAAGPQVSLQGQLAYQSASIQEPASFFSPATTSNFGTATGSIDLSVVQPLYSGGLLAAQIRGAKANIYAGREGLRQAEGQLILNVITAYCDVRRDRETVRIVKEEIAFLADAAAETGARGRVGAVSKTDVAEAQARLLVSQADLGQAQSRLSQSNAEYLNVVGENPGQLEPEPPLPGLPASVDAAFDTALANNPQLLQAVETEAAAREKVTQAKTAYRPTISMRVDAQVIPTQPYLPHQYDRNVTGALVITQPLFTSGATASKVRQAADQDTQAALNVESIRRGVVRVISDTWSQRLSAERTAELQARQVELERTSVEGNRLEERAGLRTTVDLLNAEQELVNTQIGLLQSKHDAYVASATLLETMGLLETRYLAPNVDLFSPETALKRVKGIEAPAWEGAIAAFDGLTSPRTKAPRLSPTDAGTLRPSPLPGDDPTP
jgi:outer membrane protein